MNGLYEVLDERREGQVTTAGGLWFQSRRCDGGPTSKVYIKDRISPGGTDVSPGPGALVCGHI